MRCCHIRYENDVYSVRYVAVGLRAECHATVIIRECSAASANRANLIVSGIVGVCVCVLSISWRSCVCLLKF